jgi:translation initiation factor 2 beta subunit (eIF-2beta)/eIF-5
MLHLADLEHLLTPLSTCPKCSSTDTEIKGVAKHLQMRLACTTCGEARTALVMIRPEGEAGCQGAPGTDPTSA